MTQESSTFDEMMMLAALSYASSIALKKLQPDTQAMYDYLRDPIARGRALELARRLFGDAARAAGAGEDGPVPDLLAPSHQCNGGPHVGPCSSPLFR